MRLTHQYEPIIIRDPDDRGSNPTANRPFIDIAEARFSRRNVLRGFGFAALAGAFGGMLTSRFAFGADDPKSSLTFEEIEHGIDETLHTAKGYRADVVIAWGDAVASGAPAFDPAKQSAAAQAKQFGYNCDFIGYVPLPMGSDGAANGLLCVNQEYTSAELMFPGLTEKDKLEKLTKDQVEIELAAHGHSVVEITKADGRWQVVPDSQYNRRITAETEMIISGPAAGHDRLKTKGDSSGRKVLGTINNCAGGWTPWGTILTAEENFNLYFGGDPEKAGQADAFKRYGISANSEYAWSKYIDRFNVEKEPNEPNRFGWIVEIDPYDAASTPVKRTALGRFKHEGATAVVNKDGRLVVYTGDDERFDYVYRFVTNGTYNPNDRAANLNLLDDGTLYVAQFSEDGKVKWLPLVFGQGPLTEANGFTSQADVVIETRRAADQLGATPMDRPEDLEPNPVNGHVFLVLTNNSRRKVGNTDAVNPRFENTAGHIVELIPPGEGKDADHAADEFGWEFFIIAGDPTWGGTLYGKGTSKNGWFACPDNVAFDPQGRIWIASDQGGAQGGFGIGDGVWAADTVGDARAQSRFFFRVPSGAEMCGPCFTPDGKTLFVSVQHPGEQKGSNFDTPATRWPDFKAGTPPRPAVVAIMREDGSDVGV